MDVEFLFFILYKHIILWTLDSDVTTRTLFWWNPLSLAHALRFKWVTILLIFIMSYVCSWMGFAIIYYTIETTCDDHCVRRCINNIYSFSSALLYSLETQQTIGKIFNRVREAAKKSVFFSCPANKGLPPPLELSGHKKNSNFFYRALKHGIFS